MRKRLVKKALASGPAVVLASSVPDGTVRGRKRQRFWRAFRIAGQRRARAMHPFDRATHWPF